MSSVGVVLDTDTVLDLVKEVAEKVVNPRFRDLAEEQVDEKGPGDLVTIADRESERLLTRFLQDAYPDALVLGEEAYASRPGADGAVPRGRPRLHRRSGRRHQELRQGLPRPRRDGGRGPRRRERAGVDLAAPARAGVRRRAGRRRLVQRGADEPPGAGRGPGRVARRHLTLALAGPLARGAAAAQAELGVLRRRLPAPDRGRRRLPALRPPGQPLGPRPRVAAAHASPAASPAPTTAGATGPATRWRRRPPGRTARGSRPGDVRPRGGPARDQRVVRDDSALPHGVSGTESSRATGPGSLVGAPHHAVVAQRGRLGLLGEEHGDDRDHRGDGDVDADRGGVARRRRAEQLHAR